MWAGTSNKCKELIGCEHMVPESATDHDACKHETCHLTVLAVCQGHCCDREAYDAASALAERGVQQQFCRSSLMSEIASSCCCWHFGKQHAQGSNLQKFCAHTSQESCSKVSFEFGMVFHICACTGKMRQEHLAVQVILLQLPVRGPVSFFCVMTCNVSLVLTSDARQSN